MRWTEDWTAVSVFTGLLISGPYQLRSSPVSGFFPVLRLDFQTLLGIHNIGTMWAFNNFPSTSSLQISQFDINSFLPLRPIMPLESLVIRRLQFIYFNTNNCRSCHNTIQIRFNSFHKLNCISLLDSLR